MIGLNCRHSKLELEGKIRQIRKMFSTLRHQITLLRRIRFGEIWLGDLAIGRVRSLTEKEIRFIQDCPGAGEPSRLAPGSNPDFSR